MPSAMSEGHCQIGKGLALAWSWQLSLEGPVGEWVCNAEEHPSPCERSVLEPSMVLSTKGKPTEYLWRREGREGLPPLYR